MADIIKLYRVTGNPPTIRDMQSARARGLRPINDAPESLRLHSGVSMFDSTDPIRARPWRRTAWIATIEFPEGQFRVGKTLGPGHYTVWGDPHAMLDCVTAVEPVQN